MTDGPVPVLALSGSLRVGSSNAALLRAAIALGPPQLSIVFDEGVIGALPHFNPDLDTDEPPPVVRASAPSWPPHEG